LKKRVQWVVAVCSSLCVFANKAVTFFKQPKRASSKKGGAVATPRYRLLPGTVLTIAVLSFSIIGIRVVHFNFHQL
jgi:hypothetical protein